jgi:hypothetical protein
VGPQGEPRLKLGLPGWTRRAGASRVVLASLVASALAAPAFPQAKERPTLRVGALGATLRVDGLLDEPEWRLAPASADLVMVEPRQGDRAHGRTVVRVLAGPKALVFGIRCDDPEPSGIVSFTKERDGDFESEDHVVLVLDPFQDGRSGYVFAVNPGGGALRRARGAGRPERRQELGRRVGGRHRARRRRMDGGDPDPDRDAELQA